MALLVHAFEVRHILDGSRWENQPTEWSFSPGLTEQLVLPTAAEDPIPAPQFYTAIFDDESYPDFLAESLHESFFDKWEEVVAEVEETISAPQHYTAIFTDDSFIDPCLSIDSVFDKQWEEIESLTINPQGYLVSLDLDGSDWDFQHQENFEKWEEIPAPPDLEDLPKFDMEFSPPEIDQSIPEAESFFDMWEEVPALDLIQPQGFSITLDLEQDQVLGDEQFWDRWEDQTTDLVGAPVFMQTWIDETEPTWVEEQFFFPGLASLLVLPEAEIPPYSILDWQDFDLGMWEPVEDPFPFDTTFPGDQIAVPPPIVVGLRADITVTVSETTTITVRISEVTSITASVTLG